MASITNLPLSPGPLLKGAGETCSQGLNAKQKAEKQVLLPGLRLPFGPLRLRRVRPERAEARSCEPHCQLYFRSDGEDCFCLRLVGAG